MRVVVNYLHSAAAAEQVVADIEAAGGQAMAAHTTVGVAVDPTYIDPSDPAIQAVVRAHRRALQVIHADPDTTVRHIQTFLGRHTADEARAHYARFIAPYFTTDGQADLAVGDAAITAVAAELGVPATVTAAEFYHTATAV
jgi:NitT/TauT family transport system substrate-binding protein